METRSFDCPDCHYISTHPVEIKTLKEYAPLFCPKCLRYCLAYYKDGRIAADKFKVVSLA